MLDHNQTEKEIELFIIKNLTEMHIKIEELRDSIIIEEKIMEGII